MSKNKVSECVDNYYKIFAGLPNDKPIVRSNTPEDAFTLAILKIMYGSVIDFNIKPENINSISKIIVAPPDSGIDLFIEIEDGDEYYYDIIQSKYTELNEAEIKKCFLEMQDSISKYLKNPNSITSNLRNVISETNFNKSYKSNCTYYVYHTGTINFGKNFKPTEKIITISEMEVILESLDREDHVLKVPYAEFTADMFNNYILYENSTDNAMLCNIRGYDLAELCNKYISSSMGRNILFGQNLRDSLDQKKSKTYEAMKKTIDEEPERFWNYNNGITILCEGLDAREKKNTKNVDLIEITNFSIINGAQTTNALGTYLRNAVMEKDMKKIENLKKVYVLVRIMEVNNKNLSNNISIYNNLQNPISSRDMVANNYEQKKLQSMLMSGDAPNIFVEIRRGQVIPQQPRFEKHQRITNEDLAQLAFASFLKSPYKAKEKKKALFNKDGSNEEYLVNSYYDAVFYLSETNEEEKEKGILFKKSKEEIDEVLFIKYLYTQARNKMKKYYNEKIEKCVQRANNNETNNDQNQKMMQLYQRQKEVNNTCMFYCIALYYTLKEQFGEEGKKYTFDYYSFYRNNRNSSYKEEIIDYFSTNFLAETVKIMMTLLDESGGSSANNWLKKQQSQKEFFEKLYKEMANGVVFENMYVNFIKKFTMK